MGIQFTRLKHLKQLKRERRPEAGVGFLTVKPAPMKVGDEAENPVTARFWLVLSASRKSNLQR